MLLVLWLGGGMVGTCWAIRVAIRSIGMKKERKGNDHWEGSRIMVLFGSFCIDDLVILSLVYTLVVRSYKLRPCPRTAERKCQ
jgi:hypothetical protein